MDCEIVEKVVLFEEEICISGEKTSFLKNNCCVENCELDHNNISNFLAYELAKSSSSTKASEEVLLYISTKGDSFSNHQEGLKKDDDDDDDDLNLLSGAGNNLIEEKADSGAFSSSKTVSGRRQISISTTQPMDNSCSSQFSSSNELRDESRPDQDPGTGANLANSSFSRNQFEGKAARMVRTKHGSDSLLSVIQREKSKENALVGNISEKTDDVLKGSFAATTAAAALASSRQQGTVGLMEHESPSFSSGSPPSASGGFLAFSAGSIPFSGSISQRSNSTTSTRSFAFPIIAAEWYESPVRMAEADRPPRSKKPKCWAMCFKCYRI